MYEREWENLENLSLNSTPVTDLSPLAKMTMLESLNLRYTKVTKEEFVKLQEALPNCEIIH